MAAFDLSLDELSVVEAMGYGGGRGNPHEHLLWASAGFAHFVLDTRAQGSDGRHGDTPDPGVSGDPAFPGFVTRGIRDPMTTTTAGSTPTPSASSTSPVRCPAPMTAGSS